MDLDFTKLNSNYSYTYDNYFIKFRDSQVCLEPSFVKALDIFSTLRSKVLEIYDVIKKRFLNIDEIPHDYVSID